MYQVTFKQMLIASVLTLALVLVGCSADDPVEQQDGFVTKVIDSVALAVAENLENAAVDEPVEEVVIPKKAAASTTQPEQSWLTGLSTGNEIIADGSTLYAIFDGDLVIYDLKLDDYALVSAGSPVRTIARYGDEIFVGGDQLYRLVGLNLVADEGEVAGEIATLCSFGASMIIGTTQGLFVRNISGSNVLLEDMSITALAADHGGLWVGTDGHGLYRWDGSDFKKRYLKRDTTLFDHVTTLAFGRNHLYLGTPAGLYVHDGGQWKTITVADGLPSNYISSVDASGWEVLIGTADGLVTYFQNEIKPVAKFDGVPVVSVTRIGRKIVACTLGSGLVMKSGPAMQTLVENASSGETDLAAASE